MSTRAGLFTFRKGRCLSHEECYTYLTQPQTSAHLERHLSRCTSCQDRLSSLRALLGPDDGRALPEPSPEEIEEMLDLVARAKTQDTEKAQRRSYYRTIGTAAALFSFVVLGTFVIKDLADKRKAESFLAKGRLMLEQTYSASSPGGLRLSLPFSPKATLRDSHPADELTESERFFYQALSVEPEMREAHLGLGYVFLQKGRFSTAREEFQAILDREEDYEALLGRGVTYAEEGIAFDDAADRNRYLQSALADFESALKKRPDSIQALYNKVHTLHRLARQRDSVQMTEEYLSRDSQSLWAERLKSLRAQALGQKP